VGYSLGPDLWGDILVATFYTDVISKDGRFGSPTRVSDPSLLEPTTRQLVERIISASQQMGIEVMIYETYRSQDRQQQLFNSGASKLRTVGVHHYGLACDIVRSVGGEPCWKGDFSFLGQLAQSCGLIWGGDWGAPHIKHSFIDSVHVQRCTVARQGDLFAGLWYPDETYNPYNDVQHLFADATKPPKAAPKAGRPQTKSQRV
jgi:D-alanyl-D-alanine carboxypeptidase